MWVERVPTADNIADLPSREDYMLLTKMGSEWARPVLDDAFWSPQEWENVSLLSGPSGL